MSQHRIDEGPFHGDLPLGKRPALVMIDLVRAYFVDDAPFYLGDDRSLHAAARVLSVARDVGIPVLHTRVLYTPGGTDGGYFMKKVPQLSVFVDDDPLSAFMPEVAPREGEPVITKQYASAFFGTSLAATLSFHGVDTVVLTGVSTSGCVRASAVDALQHGFIPLVVRDAVGDRGRAQHEANLFDIQAKYGEIASEIETIDYLRGLRDGN